MKYVFRQSGFSMLEVLVALVISLVTLMGAAGLVVRTVQQEVEAHQRLQALTLVQDMVDRININRQVAACYSNGAAATGMLVGKGVTESSLPACGLGSASAQARADADIDDWHNVLLGAAEQTSASVNVGAMINARGCITQMSAADQTYRVTVVWEGMSETVKPAVACGATAYTTAREKYRRAVSLIVRVGDLT